MTYTYSRLIFVLVASTSLVSDGLKVGAQTLPPGVINVPPTIIGVYESIGSNTIVNVSDGGSVGYGFNAGLSDGSSTNVLVNISGGNVGNGFVAHSGSMVNISGGNVGNNFFPFADFRALSGSKVNISGGTVAPLRPLRAFSGSSVNISGGNVGCLNAGSGTSANISGGTFGDCFSAGSGSTVEFVGGEFQLNGSLYTGSSITLAGSDVFTGTFADGSPFLFSRSADVLRAVTLTTTSLPPIDTTPIVVDGSSVAAPNGLRAGQTLTVRDGGELGDNFAAVNATLNVEGGVAGSGIEVTGSVVNISGGTVGVLRAYSGSTVNISGGTLGSSFNAGSGTSANISGGTLGNSFNAGSGSTVRISGGIFGGNFRANSGSTVELVGGEFQLNGSPYAVSSITLAGSDVFTGTLADGSPFVFSGLGEDLFLEAVALSPTSLPPIDTTPIVVDGSSVAAPNGLRAGQTLTLRDGGELGDDFAAVNATLNIEGGVAGSGIEVAGSVVNISGGTVGNDFRAYSDSTVSISGGTVGANFGAHSGSTVNIGGGSVGNNFEARSGSTVNITAGTVGDRRDTLRAYSGSTVNIGGGRLGRFDASSGSTVRISGGNLGDNFRADFGSTVEFVGGEFQLNGTPFAGPSITLAGSDVFTGTFADGSPFVFSGSAHDLFLEAVTLTTTTLPPIDNTPIVIDGVSAAAPNGLRTGQTLTLRDGGELGDNFAAVNATLNIEGGVAGSAIEVAGSAVNIGGGTVGNDFRANSGSTVSISGGTLGTRFEANPGSTVNISGGAVSDAFRAFSAVTISGGTVGHRFLVGFDSAVEFVGGEFQLNGSPYEGSSITLAGSDVFTGTFADGSPFVFSELGDLDDFFLEAVALSPTSLPPIDTTPIVVDGPSVAAPNGLRAGQTLTLRDGGELGDDFAAVNATLNVEGGVAGSGIEVAGSVVNISGGTVSVLRAYSGSTVNISGGAVGDYFTPYISSSYFGAFSDSTVNIDGTAFFLNGILVDLELGLPTVIADRDVRLSGRFADGTAFEFILDSSPPRIFPGDFFSPDATLTLTLVPEPSSGVLVSLIVAAIYSRRKRSD